MLFALPQSDGAAARTFSEEPALVFRKSSISKSRLQSRRRRYTLERLETRIALSATAPTNDEPHLMPVPITDDAAVVPAMQLAEAAPIAATDTPHTPHEGDHPTHGDLPYPQLAPEDRLPGELPHFLVGHHAGSGDWIPDVAAHPTFVAPQGTTHWSDWESQVREGDIVLIPAGAHVIYDVISLKVLKAVGVEGTLEFDVSQSTKLRVGTILVYPTGHFLIGEHELDDGARTLVTAERASYVFTTIEFEGRVDLTEDPGQMTIGLLAAGGVVHVRGGDVVDPYAQLAMKAAAGATELVLTSPVNWQTGDRIFLADTQLGAVRGQATLQNEAAIVLGVNGNIVTLLKPLQYSHEGYLAKMGRSVTFQSNNLATGDVVGASSRAKSRGHMLFTGDADVVIQGAALVRMGRTRAEAVDDTLRDANGRVLLKADGTPDYGTNQRGRYPLHAHHLTKSFVFEDNFVDGGLKWGIALHQTDGIIRRNVVVHVDGSGIASEDGSETGLIEGNLVIGDGTGSGVFDVTIVNALPAERANNSFGHGGYGYWFASPLLTVRDNIAAGQFRFEAYNYFLFGKPGLTLHHVHGRDPANVAGIDPNVLAGQPFNPTHQPILSFAGNVADVSLGDGFVSYYSNAGDWEVDNFTAYIRGANNRAVWFYYSAPGLQSRDALQGVTNSTLLGPYALGLDPSKAPPRPNPNFLLQSVGIDGNQEGATPTLRAVDTRIEGFYNGILMPNGGGDLTRLQLNNFRDIWIPWAVFPAAQVNIRDVTHGTLANATQPHENIFLQDNVTPQVNAVRDGNIIPRLVSWLNSRTDVLVYNYNGTGRDLQLYFEPQRPDYMIPIINLTNAEARSQYGLSLGDAIAPSSREPGVAGAYAGPIAEPRPAIWTASSPYVTASTAPVEYRIKFSTFDKDPAPLVVRTTLTGLQPGLNLIPVTLDYLGATYSKSLVIWGNFTT
ncbi:MAG: G8 domain-containing protein, partial [Pirellulales bacterium]